jgi:hypothetical protein
MFGSDSHPIPAAALPSSNVGLGWYNNNRKRLKKFAGQYVGEASAAVVTLRSQGEADISNPDVIASRAGFNELRVRLPVLNQYYAYTSAHGGTGDAVYLAKIKSLVLAWVRRNQPTGKPIDETNFEHLLRVIGNRWTDFTAGEQAEITTWLQALRTAKENWTFMQLAGEGLLIHGNHYTHHYKILLQVYMLLGLTTQQTALLTEITSFAARNLPYGNAAITCPDAHAVVGTSASEKRFDINGNHLSRFAVGSRFLVTGNTQNNNGLYTVVSVQYLSGSSKTRIFTAESPRADGGSGTLWEAFDPALHAMPRAAAHVGESIDYIRRDALHYHQYNLEPWLEIAILAGGSTFATVIDSQWAFFEQQILTPPLRHNEFAATTDSFDSQRWAASQPEYLQPDSMYRPDKAARAVFAYATYRQLTTPGFLPDERLIALAVRSAQLPSSWATYFRWVFGGMYG